jgi:hypothetical protein
MVIYGSYIYEVLANPNDAPSWDAAEGLTQVQGLTQGQCNWQKDLHNKVQGLTQVHNKSKNSL